MVSKASSNHSIPRDLNGHQNFGYGETNVPEHATSFNNAGSKKSKVCLNDQLIPKPTNINIAEKMINIGTPKQHPYLSHISKFAMFPSFRYPDEHETGVAHNITVLRKTKGGPYRHEVLETPMKTRTKAVTWTGEHRSLDQTKPWKEESKVFHPTAPKTVLPIPETRDWNSSFSERKSNMLKNLERSHWVTSYQMHHTGSGPANPLMMDDFKEKICDLTEMNTHAAPLRERSFPVFVPSKPRGGCRGRQRESCSPTALELPNPSQAPNPCSPPAAISQHRHREISSHFNETPHAKQKYQNQYGDTSRFTEVQSTEPSKVVLHEQPTEGRSSLCESKERENGKLQLCPSPVQVPLSQINTSGPERLTEPRGGKFSSRAASEQQRAKGRRLPGSTSNPSILPRPPVLPGIRPLCRVGEEGAALCLLDLQNAFSKSKAHHEFNCCITLAAANLRDNVVTGKKHDFYGINCYHLHG